MDAAESELEGAFEMACGEVIRVDRYHDGATLILKINAHGDFEHADDSRFVQWIRVKRDV